MTDEERFEEAVKKAFKGDRFYMIGIPFTKWYIHWSKAYGLRIVKQKIWSKQ